MAGVFPQRLKVGNPAGGELVEVEALVGTGAGDSLFPASLLYGLGIEPMGVRKYATTDGQVFEFPYGSALINITTETRDATWHCPVAFGPEGEFRLGWIALNIFKLAIDSNSNTLIPAGPMRLGGPRRLEPGGGTVRRGRLIGYTGKE